MLTGFFQNSLGTTPLEEAARGALVGAALLAILALAEWWKRRGEGPPELTRKLVHCLAGIPIAALPWALGSPWTVLALGAFFAAALRLARRRGMLCSVHGVKRATD